MILIHKLNYFEAEYDSWFLLKKGNKCYICYSNSEDRAEATEISELTYNGMLNLPETFASKLNSNFTVKFNVKTHHDTQKTILMSDLVKWGQALNKDSTLKKHAELYASKINLASKEIEKLYGTAFKKILAEDLKLPSIELFKFELEPEYFEEHEEISDYSDSYVVLEDRIYILDNSERDTLLEVTRKIHDEQFQAWLDIQEFKIKK